MKLRKEKENAGKKQPNSRKRAKLNSYDTNFINDGDEEAALVIDEEESIPIFKSPVDESEDEDDEEFDSDASHD